MKSTRFSFWDFLDTTASQRYTAPMLSSRSLGMFPTSVFGSWLAGRPLFAALSATLYLKPEHNPKKTVGIYEVSQAKRWVTCREPVQRLRFATSTRRRRKTRQKEKQKKHFRPANLA